MEIFPSFPTYLSAEQLVASKNKQKTKKREKSKTDHIEKMEESMMQSGSEV